MKDIEYLFFLLIFLLWNQYFVKEISYFQEFYAAKWYLKRNILLTTFSFKYDKALYVNSGKISLLKYLFDISIYRPV